MDISILDNSGELIGERCSATNEEIKKYFAKGFRVIDKSTGVEITESNLYENIGVSDGLITNI